ncbi:TRAP transporter large permease [Acuticoccus kandeliae]|uniref:TRAP transporter large permease n=1 Tax=Acuticoccus kandeliae TaxID=2073160 RepID=UPI000D3EBAFD|nr:TRAP transporter large permease [Acuticoccus kandeliae]
MPGALLAGLLALLATGIPVGLGIAIVGVTVGYFVIGDSSLLGVPSSAFAGVSSFLLVAIPLFILMSEILRRAGITELLFETVTRWVGHLPGGLAVAAVITSALGAAISGSSVANAAAMAIVAVPPMLERGYDRRFTYGLIAASGTLGIMIPPSIPLLLYGEITEESIGTLFIAGIIPGILLALMLICYAVFVSVRGGVYQPMPKAPWSERISYTVRATPALILPVVIVGGIYSGMVTPTEAAAVGCTYALFVATVIYRSLSLRDLWQAFFDAFTTSAMILFIISGSHVLGTVVTKLQISQDLLEMVQAMNLAPWAFVVATMVLLFALGMILEVISIIFIVLPLLHPIILSLGLDPIWFAIVFTLNMEIALITPPVGMVLYVMAGVLKRPITEIIRGIVPFVGVLAVCLAVLLLVPGFSLWLPSVLQ